MPEDPLRCSCGNATFGNIRFPDPGIMTLVCYHCSQTQTISLSAIQAELNWLRANDPEVIDPFLDHPRFLLPPDDGLKEANKESNQIGYKYGGML